MRYANELVIQGKVDVGEVKRFVKAMSKSFVLLGVVLDDKLILDAEGRYHPYSYVTEAVNDNVLVTQPINSALAICKLLKDMYALHYRGITIKKELAKLEAQSEEKRGHLKDAYATCKSLVKKPPTDADIITIDMVVNSVTQDLSRIRRNVHCDYAWIDADIYKNRDNTYTLNICENLVIEKYISRKRYPFVAEEYDGEYYIVDMKQALSYMHNAFSSVTTTIEYITKKISCTKFQFVNKESVYIGDKRTLVYCPTLNITIRNFEDLKNILNFFKDIY